MWPINVHITTIEEAIKKLQPINFEPHPIAYFVVKNGQDMGQEDYCENCIGDAVKEARVFHKEQREKIKAKYLLIETKGYCFHNGKKVKVKGKYTDKQIVISKRGELKEYPAKSTFTYEGHDPDFGGGLHRPCSCENCGDYFMCNFEPDKEEIENLLSIVNNPKPLTDIDKWEIEIALSNYQYVEDNVKPLLMRVSGKVINKLS